MAWAFRHQIPVNQSSRSGVNILGVQIEFNDTIDPRRALKITVDGRTTLNHDFDMKDPKPFWYFNAPCILKEGSSLSIQLKEKFRNLITKGTVTKAAVATLTFDVAQLTVSSKPSRNHANHVLLTDPKITIILGSMTDFHHYAIASSIDMLRQRERVLDYLKNVIEFMGIVLKAGNALSELNGAAATVLKAAQTVYQHIEAQVELNKSILDFAEEIARTLGYIEEVEPFAKLSDLIAALRDVQLLIQNLETFILEYHSKGVFVGVFFTDSHKEQIRKIKGRFDKFKQQFDRGIAVQMLVSLETFIEKDQIAMLEPDKTERGLMPAECMVGTRQDIFKNVIEWIDDSSTPNILLISGYPGTGKTAIAASLVQQLGGLKRLGSWFFFEDGNKSPKTPLSLWRTVAFDLGLRHMAFRKRLVAKMEADTAIANTGNAELLFNELVYSILNGLGPDAFPRQPVIIVDAIDACGGRGGTGFDRGLLMNTLNSWASLPKTFKIIVTSRNDVEIGQRLFPLCRRIDIHVGERTSQQSFLDISKLFEAKFRFIARKYPSLGSDWPGSEVIQRLTTKVDGLFLWACRAIDFIAKREPTEAIELVLEQGIVSDVMVELYKQIIDIGFPCPSADDVRIFHSILATIIHAAFPITRQTLSSLLFINSAKVDHVVACIAPILEPLHSSECGLKIGHPSFTYFILGHNPSTAPIRPGSDISTVKPNDSSVYFISPHTTQDVLAPLNSSPVHLDVLLCHLKDNICDINFSKGNPPTNDAILDLTERLSRLDGTLQDALQNWAAHTVTLLHALPVRQKVLELFEHKILNLIECMYLRRQPFQLIQQITAIQTSVMRQLEQTGQFMRILQCCRDVLEFMHVYHDLLSSSTLHLYSPTQVLLPVESIIYRHYYSSYSLPTLQLHVGPRHTFGDARESMAMSSGGAHCATVKGDRIFVYRGEDSSLVCTHSFVGDVWSTTFGLEEQTLTIAASSGFYRADASTGNLTRIPFEDDKQDMPNMFNTKIRQIVCAPDGAQIVCASPSAIYHVNTSRGRIMELKHNVCLHGAVDICFSTTGHTLVAGYDRSGCLVLQKFTEGVLSSTHELYRPSRRTHPFKFHPKGCQLASATDSGFDIWDPQTGRKIVTTPTQEVESMIYSDDGHEIVTTPRFTWKIKLWSTKNGECLRSIDFRSQPLLYSRTGGFLVARPESSDHRIQIHRLSHTFIRESNAVDDPEDSKLLQPAHPTRVLAFSPLGKSLVSFTSEAAAIRSILTGDIVRGPFHADIRYGCKAALHATDEYIAYSTPSSVEIVHTSGSTELKVPITHIEAISFSQDGRFVAFLTTKDSFRRYYLLNILHKSMDRSTATWQQHRTIETGFLYDEDAHNVTIAFDPASRFIIYGEKTQSSGQSNAEIALNGWRYRAQLIKADPPTPVLMPGLKEIVASTFPVSKILVQYNPDGKGKVDFRVQNRPFTLPPEFRPHCHTIHNELIAVGSQDGQILVLNCSRMLSLA